MYKIALESEGSINNVSSANIHIRDRLITDFLKLPSSVFINLRELQAETGCFNMCRFCSVNAGKIVYSLDQDALSNLFASIKFVGLKIRGLESQLSDNGTFSSDFKMPKEGLVGYGQKLRRKGAIYPYVDNNITSYTFIDRYVRYAKEDLGLKTRISTVGDSRHNIAIQKANENINNLYKQYIAALRFSFTPYTLAWSSKDSQITSRNEYILDFANTLKIYKSAVDYLLDVGEDTAIEFRFRPLIITGDKFEEMEILNKHVFHIGPYLLIGINNNNNIPKSFINGVIRHLPTIKGQSQKYFMLISDELRDDYLWKNIAKDVILNGNLNNLTERFLIRSVDMYLLSNEDGTYYSINPGMNEDGIFEKCFFPKTEGRPNSGYIDMERYFMNAILKYKKSKGLNKMSQFKEANFDDVQNVVNILKDQSIFLEKFDRKVTNYINEDILPLVEGYIKAMQLSGYAATYFFDPRFTINAGNVRNLGRGHTEYINIASKSNMAVTSEHEARYGKTSFFATEGKKWRILPFHANGNSALLVEEQDFSMRTNNNAGVIQKHIIKFEGITRLNFYDKIQKNNYIIPGLKKLEKS